jgi:hypothetical protein
MTTKNKHHHDRPAYRDDAASHAITDLFESMDLAQSHVSQGEPALAKSVVNDAINRFHMAITMSCLRDLIVRVNPVGRVEVFIDYKDDLGTIRTTYTARLPLNA